MSNHDVFRMIATGISPKAQQKRNAPLDWLPAIAIVVMTFVIYLPAIRGGEIWDDAPNITQNPLLHNLDGLREIWVNIRSMPAYYPVTHTSWWIDYHLFGLHLAFYHIENILMHAISAVLIWLALRKLKITGAWLAAALWAVHPIHVESVAWITERKNTLSVLLELLSFHCYMRAVGARLASPGSGEDGGRATQASPLRVRWYIASIVLFAIALPAKTPVVTLPAVILLAWWYLYGNEAGFWRSIFRRELIRMIPFFALSLCMGSATVWIEQHHTGATGPLFKLSPGARLVLIGRSFWFYPWKVFVPVHFNFIYPRWHIDARAWWQWLFPVCALLVIVSLLILRKRIGRGPLAAVLFYAGVALPALGIAPIFFHRYSYVSDHFAYLCNVGLLVLVAWAIVRLLQKQPVALYATCAVILVFLGIQSWRQTLLYRDNFTMWSDVLAKNPNAWLAHGNLAHELLTMHRDDEAGEHLRKQLALAPPDQVEVIVQYAQYLATHGHFEESLPYFHRGIELDPNYLNTYGFLGQALVAHGRTDEAIKLYEDALAEHPEFEPGWLDLAQIYENRGDLAHAAETYERAINAIPNTVTARVNLANLYLNARQPQPALKLLSEAAAIDDNNADVHNRYGLLLLSLGRYPEAVEQFERMVQLTKGKPGAHIAYHNLGTALEGAGRISEAVASYQRALAIKPDFAPAKRSLDRAMGKAQSQ